MKDWEIAKQASFGFENEDFNRILKDGFCLPLLIVFKYEDFNRILKALGAVSVGIAKNSLWRISIEY